MTEKQARYFMEVYTRKNIALAADELFISRPVVSRAIAELEREFGAQLFSRSNTGVEPTHAGTMLHRFISDTMVNYNTIVTGIKDLSNDDASRTLLFGVTPTNAYKAYDTLLRGFLGAFPDVRLNIIERPSKETVTLLLSGGADIIITAQEFSESHLDSLETFQAQFALGVSTNSPIAKKSVASLSDIFGVAFGLLCSPMPLEEVFNSFFSTYGKQPNIAVRSTSLELIREMARNGKIAAVLPDDMMDTWEDIAIVPLDFFSVRTHRLVWNKRIHHNTAFDDLLAYARQVFS